ncbi:uncharacterized protein BDR25DRAFT_352882 [Lindgomyces ingoldianus]|uniref:Uncharacterized protein n=1 Tax=Lindgomyces ingoldianus TaxID=673940 RepID=A0ACB6R2I0_9PLEO|nr:uncharacterized protein BDR25DRAFT_352882 [Lindgomyces ingoldianus]KAF2473459.1 hypothetical protein BDR25DRAFT_352882 [Lindgomyces ingoldianus]
MKISLLLGTNVNEVLRWMNQCGTFALAHFFEEDYWNLMQPALVLNLSAFALPKNARNPRYLCMDMGSHPLFTMNLGLVSYLDPLKSRETSDQVARIQTEIRHHTLENRMTSCQNGMMKQWGYQGLACEFQITSPNFLQPSRVPPSFETASQYSHLSPPVRPLCQGLSTPASGVLRLIRGRNPSGFKVGLFFFVAKPTSGRTLIRLLALVHDGENETIPCTLRQHRIDSILSQTTSLLFETLFLSAATDNALPQGYCFCLCSRNGLCFSWYAYGPCTFSHTPVKVALRDDAFSNFASGKGSQTFGNAGVACTVGTRIEILVGMMMANVINLVVHFEPGATSCDMHGRRPDGSVVDDREPISLEPVKYLYWQPHRNSASTLPPSSIIFVPKAKVIAGTKGGKGMTNAQPPDGETPAIEFPAITILVQPIAVMFSIYEFPLSFPSCSFTLLGQTHSILIKGTFSTRL